jgi:hypothetical protein
MMLENVEEFKTWGPLLAAEMRPDPDRVGETFEAFVGMLTPEFLQITLRCWNAANFWSYRRIANRRCV